MQCNLAERLDRSERDVDHKKIPIRCQSATPLTDLRAEFMATFFRIQNIQLYGLYVIGTPACNPTPHDERLTFLAI